MQLNTTTDYGIRVVLHLTRNYLAQEKLTSEKEKKYVVSSSIICEEMGVPPSLMHKIVKPLKKAGILHEVRGSRGGFELNTVALDDLTILTIVRTFEKTVNINKCLEKKGDCKMHGWSSCPVRTLYRDTQDEMHKRLDVKVLDLVRKSALA